MIRAGEVTEPSDVGGGIAAAGREWCRLALTCWAAHRELSSVVDEV
jgi:hypothetical protein